MDLPEFLDRALSAESYAHLWGLILIAALLVAYRFASKRVRNMPELPTGLILIFLVLRVSHAGLPPDANPHLLLGLDIASAIAIGWAGANILFSITIGAWYRLRNKAHAPKITRDLCLFVSYAVIVFVVLRVRGGVNLVGLITTSAVLTAVIGLAAQNFLGNLFSGLSIQIEQPFRIGDWIESAGHQGRVVHIGWEATHILTFDDELIILPNLDISKSVIKNHSQPTPRHAMKLEVGVEYGATPGRVRAALMEACREEPRVLKEPAPAVRILAFADFAVTYQIRFFYDGFGISPDLRGAMMEKIWYVLRRHGIAIPFPIREVAHRHIERKFEAEEAAKERHEALLKLDGVPILAPLAPESRRDLAAGCKILRYGDGEIIVHQGDAGDTLFILHEGRCDVEVAHGDQPASAVATLYPPAFFGEMSLLTGDPRTATIRARGDTTAFAIDRALFRDVLAAHPEIFGELARVVAERQAANAEAADKAKADAATQASKLLERIKTFFKI